MLVCIVDDEVWALQLEPDCQRAILDHVLEPRGYFVRRSVTTEHGQREFDLRRQINIAGLFLFIEHERNRAVLTTTADVERDLAPAAEGECHLQKNAAGRIQQVLRIAVDEEDRTERRSV